MTWQMRLFTGATAVVGLLALALAAGAGWFD
jgi:hypothetical protein